MVCSCVKKTSDNIRPGLHQKPWFQSILRLRVLNDLFLTVNNMIPLSFSLIFDLRQGYQEDLSRSSRSAYDEYYANYYKRQYDAYGGKDCLALQTDALYASKGWMWCFYFFLMGLCLCMQIRAGGMIQMLLMIHATKPTMIRHMAGTMTLMVTEKERRITTNNIKTGTFIHPCIISLFTC